MVRRHASPAPVPSRNYLLIDCFKQWLACFIACVIHKIVVEEFVVHALYGLVQWMLVTDSLIQSITPN